MISTLFSSLNIKVKSISESTDAHQEQENISKETAHQPVLLIMQQTMPIFKEIATLWINEISVIEV